MLTKDNNNWNNTPINDNVRRNNNSINMGSNRNKYSAKIVLGKHKLMSNNMNKVKRKCEICKNMFEISDALSKKNQNPLNIFSSSCYEKSKRETLLSNELEDGNQNTTKNSKIIVEVDKDKTSNNNNSKNHEEVKMKNEVDIINKNRLIAKNNNLF